MFIKNGSIRRVNIKNFNMKDLFKLTLICLLISTGMFSQSIEKLDEKNGFKELKLGDTFYKWQQNLTYQRTDDNVKIYFYNGECCKTIFGFSIKSILLYFADNKLIKIGLLHKTTPESEGYKIDASKIFSGIVDSFGLASSKDNISDGKVIMYWFGKKVGLFSTWTYLGATEGQQYEIFIYDSVFLNKKKSDGF